MSKCYKVVLNGTVHGILNRGHSIGVLLEDDTGVTHWAPFEYEEHIERFGCAHTLYTNCLANTEFEVPSHIEQGDYSLVTCLGCLGASS